MSSERDASLRRAADLHRAGKLAEAEACYRELLASRPDDARVAHWLGVLLLQSARSEEALEFLRLAVEHSPSWAEALNNFGVALRDHGRIAEAVEAFRAAAREQPTMFDAQNNLAEALLGIDATDQALEVARIAERLNPGHPGPRLAIGVAHFQRREYPQAVERLSEVLAIVPGEERAAALIRLARGRQVQPWHFAMLNERARNDAYDAAMRRAIPPGALVLEIGTGSGLLAMMAARAGAGHVVGCEMVKILADKARAIITQNGFAERITVHDKRSDELRVGVELPSRARVLVSELFDSNVLGEGVLSSLEDAHARLLEPGATLIPRAASAMVELAGGDALAQTIRVGISAGFDMSLMNEYSPERLVFDGGRMPYERLSAPFEAFRIDFREAIYPPGRHVIPVRVTRSGICLGVVQWLRIELDEEFSYENRPDESTGYLSPWLPTLYTFENPVALEAGATLLLSVVHGHESLVFRVADSL